MTKKINTWLLSKLNDHYIKDIKSESELPSTYYGNFNGRDFYKYYYENDIDLRNSDNISLDLINSDKCTDLDSLKKSIECYDDKSVLILPGSNQSHANYLFKRLIDVSSNMSYEVPITSETGDVTFKNVPLIDVYFKNEFYKHCYTQTTHK